MGGCPRTLDFQSPPSSTAPVALAASFSAGSAWLTVTFDQPMDPAFGSGLGWSCTKAGSGAWTSTGIFDVSGSNVTFTMTGGGGGSGSGTAAFTGAAGSVRSVGGDQPAAIASMPCGFP